MASKKHNAVNPSSVSELGALSKISTVRKGLKKHEKKDLTAYSQQQLIRAKRIVFPFEEDGPFKCVQRVVWHFRLDIAC